MYNYTPIGVYAAKSFADEKRENRESKSFFDDELYINPTELNTVKTLYQIRNANFYKKKITNNYRINIFPKERVFIAGKIFPVINLIFKETTNLYNASNITLRNWKSNDPIFNSKIHNKQYISVDNDNLMILLPISYSGINFPELMLDFLTNGMKTKHTIGGEFPDYSTYKLALREQAIDIKNWKGQDGCWLTRHRDNNSEEWRRGYSYIIEHKIKGRLAPFAQIYKFYDCVDWYITNVYKHEVKWCKGAKKLVAALSSSSIYVGGLEGGSNVIDNGIETILNELNLGICDYAIGKFHELIYGKYAKTPLKGDNAYNWDVEFITYEQGTVAPPIYKKTNSETIRIFQMMSDKDGLDGGNGVSMQGGGSWVLNKVTPSFDDFTPKAKVTDDQFRIDLPLLMLYLDKHKPKWSGFKQNLNSDGTVNADIKKIIKPFVIS
ncbi:hypothetical protein [Chryseobacterium kwangjuense]|uniref:Uncharacterized protein n=1 Tax=Chryseobacterium kwangjuense TaxID=267125 RepID=A0A135WE03_9FLAO|nr:hypothetical protein [Chryseobacterium kwangjuense]KXH83148.1 hypothetical protein AU378_12040 [Chryseobacterium kwangjuense]